MTFQKGESGNPAGRPRDARGKAALLAEKLFAGESEEIICAAFARAKEGDLTARVCLELIAPRPKDDIVDFELPAPNSAARALALWRRRRQLFRIIASRRKIGAVGPSGNGGWPAPVAAA